MKKIYLILLLSALSNFLHAQSTCRSAYDTNTNNVYSPTSYFPGPMPVPLNTDIYGTIDSGTDVDYYKFNITTSGSIRMSLSLKILIPELNQKFSANLRITTIYADGGKISKPIIASLLSMLFVYRLIDIILRKVLLPRWQMTNISLTQSLGITRISHGFLIISTFS